MFFLCYFISYSVSRKISYKNYFSYNYRRKKQEISYEDEKRWVDWYDEEGLDFDEHFEEMELESDTDNAEWE